ncbi:MAG: hypothetical protein LZF86_230004 [Nitrospira sp.]|nr:MAG: hypothetical protein LZF86_230004 [Nitrospira sp.]
MHPSYSTLRTRNNSRHTTLETPVSFLYKEMPYSKLTSVITLNS